mgnify:CR=1 FL=1
MSWMQNLCDTYEACEEAIGICGESQATMLLPIGHLLTGLDVIIHLRSDGTFERAEKIKAAANSKTIICVPCTDESEARSGTKAIGCPHPLFDQLKYLCTQKYNDNLAKWLAYLGSIRRFPLANQAINAVYHYVVKGTLSDDLQSFKIVPDEKVFVGFCVNLDDALENRLWMIPEMWSAWIDFYLNEDLAKRQSRDFCYITGLGDSIYTEKHPKSINRAAGNAKLITGNDNSNFTFRGRFWKASQAVTVSYEASQKAHQALRWLIAKPSSYRCDSQAIIAWAIDKVPDIPNFYDDSFGIYNAVARTNAEKLIQGDDAIYVDYANTLKRVLSGQSASRKLRIHARRIAILSTDSATTGRLSVTYYRQLSENEYEERIDNWHNTCKWYQQISRDTDGICKSGYFIGAPAIDRITLAVLGKRRSQQDESYDKLVKNLREQLLHCIFDGERIPASMVNAAISRASNPIALENTDVKNGRWRDWEHVLCATCALVKRYFHDYKKEEFAVELDTERHDRDYLFGRLLAVADRIESSARYKQDKTREDDRPTNAIRYMTAFSQHPFRTWNMLFTQQLNPYIQQLNGAGWYLNLIGEIKQLFDPNVFEVDTPLDGRYLLGFFAQRQELRMRPKTKNDNGGEDNELDKEN